MHIAIFFIIFVTMNELKNFDHSFLTRKIKLIAGVDEAGRGPLAGPVVAASVIFEKKVFHPGINDSKKISEVKREELYSWITENCLSYGIGIIDHTEIDQINILQATLKAMKVAVANLNQVPHLILIDGNKAFHSSIAARTIVKGDLKSFSIAAASILAKVTRDRMMKKLAKKFPQYGWEHNKGYGTREHIEAIHKFGISRHHRITFLNNILNEAEQEFNFAE